MSVISSRAPDLAEPATVPTAVVRHPRTGLVVDVALAVFVVAMMILMLALPGHESGPFHFIFFGLALAYGYRVWPVAPTVAVILVISLPSGWLLVSHAEEGFIARAQLAEIPVMPLVMLAMVWHAQRRVTALRQVTELVRLQQAGVDREREFFRDASHAIRAPVTVARGHLELAAMTPLPDQVQADLSVALTQLERMSALSNRLLALARLDTGSALRRQPTDLAELVRELGDNWRPSADRRWSVSSEETGILLVDPEWLAMAVDALLENAVHFTADGDAISLTCRVTQTTCTIVVADSGPGIGSEDLGAVFDRFWHRMPPNGPEGTGLGLSMAHAAASAHDGSLTVRNAVEGGAIFELTLPRTRPAG